MQLRREVGGILERDTLRRERRQHRLHRLRRPRYFARHVALRDRALLDRPHRQPRDAIESECEALLRELDHGVDGFAAVHKVHENGRTRRVVVPEPVVHELVVPAAPARARIETNERVAEQSGARPIAAVEVVAGRADRQVQQASPLVERHRGPDVGMPGVVVRALAPGVAPQLAVARHGVERPHLLAGSGIVRAHIARWIVAIDQPVGDPVAYDHEIAIDERRRSVCVVLGVDLPCESREQIDDAVLTETLDRSAGLRVELDEPVAAVNQDSQRAGSGVSPCRDAAMHKAHAVRRLPVAISLRVVSPELAAGRCFECNDAVVRRAQIHDAVNDDRRRLEEAGRSTVFLEWFLVRLPLPGELEAGDVRCVDVRERRILACAGITAVDGPVLVGPGGDRGPHR